VKLTRTWYNLTVADKASLPILGDTNFHFEVDGNRFEANVSVSPAIDDFLLGSDWLEANGAKWDFTTGTLHFGDHVIRAYRRTLGKLAPLLKVGTTPPSPCSTAPGFGDTCGASHCNQMGTLWHDYSQP